MARIRKGDMIEVVSGNDRGKRGRVLRVIHDKDRLVVQGVNMRWKHLRKSQQNPQGGRVRREAPVHISNVMFFDEAAGERTRIAYQREEGRKIRINRKTGVEVGAAPAGKQAEPASKTEPASKKEPVAKGEAKE